MAETNDAHSERSTWARIRDRSGLILSWSLWAALTVALIVYIRQYSRNIPYMDEFAMVPVMTGSEPVSLRWAWAQHNEHRPLISRLIMAGLTQFVSNDFRTPRYANVALLATMAAAMLVLARRIRGSARLTDAVIPLAILNVAQAESLMIGFAMNLILTSALAIALIVVVSRPRRSGDGAMALGFGLALVLLPLTGGSGLVMIPPLAAWLAGYIAWGWWSGRSPLIATRAVGLGLIMAGSAIALLYLWGYDRPSYHPLSHSAAAVASSTLMFLSLTVYPHLTSYWWPAGPIVAALVMATLGLLTIASIRSPVECPRAFALMAIIASMLCVGAAVGVSRAGFGPAAVLASRYVTLTFPLLCVLYIAWLLYGRPRVRVGFHMLLLALIGLSLPDVERFSRKYGLSVRVAEERVERGLKDHVPTAKLLTWACPSIYPNAQVARVYFQMLKLARVGVFANYEEGQVAASPTRTESIRR
jgi:hypothetical protein